MWYSITIDFITDCLVGNIGKLTSTLGGVAKQLITAFAISSGSSILCVFGGAIVFPIRRLTTANMSVSTCPGLTLYKHSINNIIIYFLYAIKFKRVFRYFNDSQHAKFFYFT